MRHLPNQGRQAPRIEGEARTEVERRGPSNEAPPEGKTRVKAPLPGLPGGQCQPGNARFSS